MSKIVNAILVATMFVALFVSLFAAVQPVMAGGPIVRFYSPKQCNGMVSKWATMTGYMSNPRGQFVCETRKSSWLEQRKWDAQALIGKAQAAPSQVQDYVQKDVEKHINVVTICNIYQITTGRTQYCTMPK